MSEVASPESAPSRRPRSGTGRAIRWLLGLQIVIALLLMGGDLMRVAPELLSGFDRTPATEMPVRPGDQTRRYAPRLLVRDGPGGPGFPADAVPDRLTWEMVEIDDAPALLLTGRIEGGDGTRFAEYLDTLIDPPEMVALFSPGGSVTDALEIGRRLRVEGMSTRVGRDAACFSACPYILAGGVERIVSREAQVGVHQHFFGESTVLPAFLAVADIQRGQADVIAYLDEMGVDPLLTAKGMQTPPADIYILLEDELHSFALATSMID